MASSFPGYGPGPPGASARPMAAGEDSKGKGKATGAQPGKAAGKGKADIGWANALRTQLDHLVPWITRLQVTVSSIDLNGETVDFNLETVEAELRGFRSQISFYEESRDFDLGLCNAFAERSRSRDRSRSLAATRGTSDTSSSAEPEQQANVSASESSMEFASVRPCSECMVCRRPCVFCNRDA